MHHRRADDHEQSRSLQAIEESVRRLQQEHSALSDHLARLKGKKAV